MKHLIKKSTIAVAVTIALGSSAAWAQEPPALNNDNTTPKVDPTDSTISTVNKTSVKLSKDINVSKKLDLVGKVLIAGKIAVNSSAMAIVDNKQLNYKNVVDMPDPNFNVTTGIIDGNTGNLGINATSGENNQQDNAAAIATSDKSFLLGSTDAETFTHQSVWDNQTTVTGATYTLNAGDITNNTGNVGVNISVGVSNLQKNNLAIATGVSGLAEASSATLQETTGISTTLQPGIGGPGGITPVTYTTTLGTVSANAGNVGVNVATGNNNLQANSLAISAVF